MIGERTFHKMIEIKGLSKVYDNGFTALRDIDLKVEDGDIFGIIGLSGAGKSTLVRCINLLEKPTEGQVIIDGRDLCQMGRKELLESRRRMSMIFQGFNLLNQRTALKNVMFPLEISKLHGGEAKKQALDLLETVGLADKAGAYPAQLSGGQKQRVAIARALATNPKVILCDEATSALDPNTTAAILELLREINKKMGVTIIIITHEMKVIEQVCTRVAVIDQSRIVEEGSVRDVFLSPKSDIAKQLILPQNLEAPDGRVMRLIFDGSAACEPVIANLAIECRAAVSILGADTRNENGRAYGRMLVQLPKDETTVERIKNYLKEHNIIFREHEE